MVTVSSNSGGIARISGVYVNEAYPGMSLEELGITTEPEEPEDPGSDGGDESTD